MNKKTLIDLIGLTVLVAVVVIGYRFSPLLLPQADLVIEPPATCDLHRQTCHVALPEGGGLALSMQPQPIPLMAPFRVEVKLTAVEARSVEIDFAGVEMNMGLNRFSMSDQGKGIWATEASIPVCVTGRMEWLATVMILRGQQRISVPFRFISSGGNS